MDAQAPRPATAAATSATYDKQLQWQASSQRKLQQVAQNERLREAEQCTFAPKIITESARRSPQKVRAPTSLPASEETARSPRSPESSSSRSSTAVTAVHPTEAQESSILLHLARQERARDFAHTAQQKLATAATGKDFTKPTKAAPFALSTSNWTPRQAIPTDLNQTSPSRLPTSPPAKAPNQQTAESAVGSIPPAPVAATGPSTKHRTRSRASSAHNNNHHSHSGSARSLAAEDAWETERATLVAVLDAQRRELALRARAQADAVRAAENFAAATQRFEDRLTALETRTADELREIRRLLARQTAASDLILRSLGLTPPSASPPPSPPSSSKAAEFTKTV